MKFGAAEQEEFTFKLSVCCSSWLSSRFLLYFGPLSFLLPSNSRITSRRTLQKVLLPEGSPQHGAVSRDGTLCWESVFGDDHTRFE